MLYISDKTCCNIAVSCVLYITQTHTGVVQVPYSSTLVMRDQLTISWTIQGSSLLWPSNLMLWWSLLNTWVKKILTEPIKVHVLALIPVWGLNWLCCQNIVRKKGGNCRCTPIFIVRPQIAWSKSHGLDRRVSKIRARVLVMPIKHLIT